MCIKMEMLVTMLKVAGIFLLLLCIIPDNIFNLFYFSVITQEWYKTAASKSLQLGPTLCDCKTSIIEIEKYSYSISSTYVENN